MSGDQRLVAGLYCREVLELLSAYLDGELDEARRRQVESHVAGCDWCERFGASFAAVVRALRAAGAALTYRELPELSHTYPRSENLNILRWLEALPPR